jgi:hypothetical protein
MIAALEGIGIIGIILLMAVVFAAIFFSGVRSFIHVPVDPRDANPQ